MLHVVVQEARSRLDGAYSCARLSLCNLLLRSSRCLAVVKPTTQPKQYNRSPQDKVELATPQFNYEQNKSIQDIPVDNLIKIFPTPDNYRQTADKFELDAGVIVKADVEFATEEANLKKGTKSFAAAQSQFHLDFSPRSLMARRHQCSTYSHSPSVLDHSRSLYKTVCFLN